jgi:hypothetical protein
LATIENGLVLLEKALGSPIHLAELITLSGRPDDDQVRLDRRKGGADTPLTVHPRFV